MESSASSAPVRRAALVVATMASFLTPFLGSSINVALPTIGRELHLSPVALSWVATAFMLASAVCLVPFGRLADIVGRRRVFLIGMITFTATSLACGFAASGAALIALRALQGVGGAMIFSTGLAILTAVHAPGERGRVLGLNAAAVYAGLSAGPFLGGMLTRLWGWPGVFYATAPLGLATAVVAWRGLRGEWTGDRQAGFDAIGTVLYALALSALMIGLSLLRERAGILLVAAAAALFAAFLAWERRVSYPIIDVGLLASNPVFARSNLAALINYAATFAATFLLSLHLQYLRGLDPGRAGLVLLSQSVVMAAVSPLAGRLSDRWEPRIVASAGMGLGVAGLGWLAFLQADTSLGVIITALVVIGVGFGLFSSPNTNAVMSSVPARQLGVASATLGTMRLVGQMLSLGVAAAIIAAGVGPRPLTPELHPRFLMAERTAFLVFAGLCVLGLVASLTRGNVRGARR